MTDPQGNGAKRVVVIGGGVVGVSAASWLRRDGCRVTIVDPGQITAASSYGNAGCFNPSSVVPMSMPGNLWKAPGWLLDPLGPLSIRWAYIPTIAPWLVRFLRAGAPAKVAAQAAALGDLLRDSLDRYAPLVANAGAEALVRRDGHLMVYRSRDDFAADALALRLRRDNGVAFEVLDGRRLQEREPALSQAYAVGVHFPHNGHTVNPGRFVARLAEAFLRDGGEIVAAEARGFAFDGDRLTGLRTSGPTLACDAAVVAAGARSAPFARLLGDAIPLDTERGYHIMIPAPSVALRQPVMDTSGKFVATPMQDGLRIAGTVEFAGLSAQPDWRRAHKLLTLAQRLLPDLQPAARAADLPVWMGFRPSLPDSLPVIGASRRSRDVVYAFGHGHVGMTAGAQTGLLVSDLIHGRPPRMPIEAFSPRRFR